MFDSTAPEWRMIALGTLVTLALVFWALALFGGGKGSRLRDLAGQLGAQTVPNFILILGLLFWGALFLSLFAGVIWVIWGLILAALPVDQSATWDFRFELVKLTALTATLGAVVALPLTLIRLRLTREQNDHAKDILFNEKVTDAVLGLSARRQRTDHSQSETEPHDVWEDDIERRYFALLTLGRLTSEQDSAAVEIAEYLCAFIRYNSPVEIASVGPVEKVSVYTEAGILNDSVINELLGPEDTTLEQADFRWARNLRGDPIIQAAVTCLGRLCAKSTSMRESRFRMDLTRSNLQGLDFSRGDFRGARFTDSKLEGANFSNANLSGALFVRSSLNYCIWTNCQLPGARLDHSDLSRPKAKNSGWHPTLANATDLRGTNFSGANLSSVYWLGRPEISNQTFGTKDTVLSDELDESRSLFYDLTRELKREENSLSSEKLKALKHRISQTGFESWSKFDSNDLSVHFDYRELLSKIGLTGFPYD